ncbi:hypothetical protein EDC94DRAFT_602876 [Helicostylum pulchrum]|nr:hypothetical protein EDC94DRAFT_602876 [Helicostylum pulchrum]
MLYVPFVFLCLSVGGTSSSCSLGTPHHFLATFFPLQGTVHTSSSQQEVRDSGETFTTPDDRRLLILVCVDVLVDLAY